MGCEEKEVLGAVCVIMVIKTTLSEWVRVATVIKVVEPTSKEDTWYNVPIQHNCWRKYA